jgi:hypothetical protein
MSKHGRSVNLAAQRGLDLADSFAIIGPAAYCCERLLELAELGVDRFYVVGPSRDADPDAANNAVKRFTDRVLPKLVVSERTRPPG